MVEYVLGGFEILVVVFVTTPANDLVCPCRSVFSSDDILSGVGDRLILGSRLFRRVNVRIHPRVERDFQV